jgi:hypothetical protein
MFVFNIGIADTNSSIIRSDLEHQATRVTGGFEALVFA